MELMYLKKRYVDENIEVCKGLYYRCRTNDFISGKGHYISNYSMIPLIRKSCKGCADCGFLLDDLHESVANGNLPIVDKIINGGTYKLEIDNVYRNPEYGNIEDWEIHFKLVKEEK